MYLLEKESVRSSSSLGTGLSGGGLTGSGGGIQPEILLIVGVVALITAILVFVLVVKRKKSFKGKFANWIKEFLNFRSILVAGIIKILYIFLAVFLTIMSIIVMFQGKGDDVLPMVLSGLAMLIFGNILLRVMLEMTMAMIVVWENTSDIRLLLVKRDELFRDGGNRQWENKEPVVETPSETKRSEVSQKSETPDTPKAPRSEEE
ncbi:DUF4282 domain-containing protein [Candidatus Saccharibacteria bacterium]|nr:DUF4282 domain-containing protein [Candidatus Saccharibacteria bacterium]